MNWHLLPISEISQLLSTTPSGIDNITARERLEEYGSNKIEEKHKKTVVQLVFHQFADFMIIILIAAAMISGIIGDLEDTLVILAIVVINAVVGFIQEYRAGKAIEALKNMAATHARVLREKKAIMISAYDLVPGDVVLLEAGDVIPADVRFFECHKIIVDESSLTGESHHTRKMPDELPEAEYALGDRVNMGFKGTVVTNGRGSAYVVATGMNTELALIAKLIQAEEIQTPLQKRLSTFGRRLAIAILILSFFIFLVGLLRGEPILSMLLTSVSLAVAAIPEALPVVVTIALALGAKRLSGKNALIRKLPAVETLGSVTYICSDKTGTLTQNRITVQESYADRRYIINETLPCGDLLLTAIALNNDATKNKEGIWHGESTEVALARYAADRNIERTSLEIQFPRLTEIPFDAERKCMTTLHRIGSEIYVITKGAPEVLLGKLVDGQTKFIPQYAHKLNEMAQNGYRVLGYGIRKLQSMPEKLIVEEIETSLIFIGFVGMIDVLREEAKNAVLQCKEAGIVPVMITGDHKLTAIAIAKSLHIISSNEQIVLSGPELSKLTQEDFENIVEKVRVYARVSPEQKMKIVRALQDKHQFVAMTGDGVNDAPALKNANIGIAMGLSGTEVAKEAAHMILLDDNFATIVTAVQDGRKIFDNILKFIKYIMTGNSGELWAIFLAPFLGLPIPLLPIHILWVNLLSDGLPGLALASEPADASIMKRPPRKPDENIFSRAITVHILWVGLLIAFLTLGTQASAIKAHNSHWQTLALTVLCFVQLGHSMAIRSDKESIFKIGFFTNKPMVGAIVVTFTLQLSIIYIPFLNQIFKTQPLTGMELTITILVSSLVFWAVEIEKWFKRHRAKQILFQSLI